MDLFLSIAREYPADPMALWAFKDACVIGIEQAHPDIETRISALTAGFAADERLAQALCEVGDAWRKAGDFDRCVQTYNQVIELFPDDVFALWSQKNLVTLAIEQKKADQADAAFQRLIDNHRSRPELARAVNDIADAARAAGDPVRARVACQFVIDQFPMTNDSLWARQKLIVLDIDESEKTNTTPDVPAEILAAVDQLIADYPGFDDLPLAVLVTGEYYYNAALALEKEGRRNEAPVIYARAIPICERMIKVFPNSDCTSSAYFVAAVAYDRMGQTGNAISYRVKILDNWPGYENADSAQCLLAANYEKLAQTTPSGSFKSMSSQNYAALIENYPASRYAPYAINKLGGFAFEEKDYPQAAMYFEKLRDQYETREFVDSTPLFRLGQTYEAMGMKEQAEKEYESFQKAAPSNHPLKYIVNKKLQSLKVSQ